jgi:hypothetical protein
MRVLPPLEHVDGDTVSTPSTREIVTELAIAPACRAASRAGRAAGRERPERERSASGPWITVSRPTVVIVMPTLTPSGIYRTRSV